MPILNGVTHAIIQFNSKIGYSNTNIQAMMKLCFGSDDDALSQVLYMCTGGSKTPVWTLPTRVSNDMAFPIFSGILREEIMGLVGIYSERFRKTVEIVGPKYGRVWRVTKTTAEEIIKGK